MSLGSLSLIPAHCVGEGQSQLSLLRRGTLSALSSGLVHDPEAAETRAFGSRTTG
jgi:hypothetical protein